MNEEKVLAERERRHLLVRYKQKLRGENGLRSEEGTGDGGSQTTKRKLFCRVLQTDFE